MANKLLSMHKIRQILLFLECGTSQRSIEKEVKVSRKTIALYLQKFIQTEISFADLLNVPTKNWSCNLTLTSYTQNREALEQAYTEIVTKETPIWSGDGNLLDWLESFS